MYKKRCIELERRERDRASRWPTDYPGGVNFINVLVPPLDLAACRTANVLGHYIVAIPGDGFLRLFGIPVKL